MPNPRTATLIILIVLTATIAGAWIFEATGIQPCHLCLMQRWAYYGGIPLAAAVWLAFSLNPAAARWGLALLGLMLAASAVFGAYHAGVEWKFWPGPGTCTGTGELGGGLPSLTDEPVIACDDAAIRSPSGFLSLAGWNAVISAALSALAFSSLWGGRHSASLR